MNPRPRPRLSLSDFTSPGGIVYRPGPNLRRRMGGRTYHIEVPPEVYDEIQTLLDEFHLQNISEDECQDRLSRHVDRYFGRHHNPIFDELQFVRSRRVMT